jgi:hypothetical protein
MRKMPVPVDAINRRELEDRADVTPAQLIAELRLVGPKAIRTRRNLPGFIRALRIPALPMPGKMSMAYLVDVVYPRDQWMHRMDLCRATGQDWIANPDHDRRLLDLIIRDMTYTPAGGYAVALNVTGPLNAAYRFGHSEPAAEIDIDFIELNRRASGRTSADEALASAQVRGDESVARAFLDACEVLY